MARRSHGRERAERGAFGWHLALDRKFPRKHKRKAEWRSVLRAARDSQERLQEFFREGLPFEAAVEQAALGRISGAAPQGSGWCCKQMRI